MNSQYKLIILLFAGVRFFKSCLKFYVSYKRRFENSGFMLQNSKK